MGSAIFSFVQETVKKVKSLEQYMQSIYTLQRIREPFTTSGVEALKQWTGKASAKVIYDSNTDEFTADGLFNKVKGKPNVALVGFTTDGDVFGGFYSVAVTEQDEEFEDPNIFAFSFESHGRCETPKRFPVKKEWPGKNACVRLWKIPFNGFVTFGVDGVGGFWLGNEKSGSFCFNMSCEFEGLEDSTFTGKTGLLGGPPLFHCTRMVAVQLA